jgi:hypothetical protein
MTTKKMALSATVITPSWEVDNNASAAGTATVPKSAQATISRRRELQSS